MKYSDVEIKTKDVFGTEIYIDGEKLDLKGVRAYSLTQEAGEFPILKLEMYVKSAKIDGVSGIEVVEIPIKSGD